LLSLAALSLAMGSKQAREKKLHAADSALARQGIAGRVEIWEGNFMPMIDPAKFRSQIHPGVGRRVRAYLPVNVEGGLVSARRDTVASPMVAETVCDSAGVFFVPTPTGTYSVFVEENNGWYYNGFNGEGIQGAVTVDSGKTATIVIKITTKATF
jgi:hypothetical protein